MKRCRRISVIHVILSVICVTLGVAISAAILMQEGKSNGLRSVTDGIPADSCWNKSRSRSMEGALKHFTRYGAIVLMLITTVLNVILKVMG